MNLNGVYTGAAALDELEEYQRRRRAGEIITIPTGLEFIDRHLEIEQGNVVVIASRPGGGKTSTMCSIAAAQIERKLASPVFFSLEMSRREITSRLLSNLSGVRFSEIKHCNYSHATRAKVDKAKQIMRTANLQISDDCGQTVSDLFEAIALFRGFGSNIVFIDQLSKIRMNGKGSRFEKFSETMGDIKQIARELNMPIVLACQVRRGEDHKPRAPVLRDLKETGSIEEDADIVLMPFRPDSEGDVSEIVFNKQKVSTGGRMFMYCRKYRNGEPWQEMTHFDGPTMTLGRTRA